MGWPWDDPASSVLQVRKLRSQEGRPCVLGHVLEDDWSSPQPLTLPKGDRPWLWASSSPMSTSQLSALGGRRVVVPTHLHGVLAGEGMVPLSPPAAFPRPGPPWGHLPGRVAAVREGQVPHSQVVECPQDAQAAVDGVAALHANQTGHLPLLEGLSDACEKSPAGAVGTKAAGTPGHPGGA